MASLLKKGPMFTPLLYAIGKWIVGLLLFGVFKMSQGRLPRRFARTTFPFKL